MQNLVQPRDESTKSLHDYLSNNYYKNIVALSLILMFSIVFHLIYLIVDLFSDKKSQHILATKLYEQYELKKRRKMLEMQQKEQSTSNNNNNNIDVTASVEMTKEAISNRNKKIEFNIWSNKNLQISFIHSVLCSVWLIRILCFNKYIYNDLLTYVSWDTYLLLAFSCGYFLYDFYDIYANGHFKLEWVVCVHHFIVLLTFSYHMIYLLNIGYTTLALCMEFNSVFLHARKLLRFYEFKKDSLIVKLNSVFNILTFIVFRFGVLVTIFLGIKRDGHRVTTNYLVMLTTCTIAMAIINIVLFKRILVKDWLNNCTTNKNSIKVTYTNGNHKLNDNIINNHDEKENLLDTENLIENELDKKTLLLTNIDDLNHKNYIIINNVNNLELEKLVDSNLNFSTIYLN